MSGDAEPLAPAGRRRRQRAAELAVGNRRAREPHVSRRAVRRRRQALDAFRQTVASSEAWTAAFATDRDVSTQRTSAASNSSASPDGISQPDDRLAAHAQPPRRQDELRQPTSPSASCCSAIPTSTIATRNGRCVSGGGVNDLARAGARRIPSKRDVGLNGTLSRDARPAPGRPRLLVVCQDRRTGGGIRRATAGRHAARARGVAKRFHVRRRSRRHALSLRRAHPPREPAERRLSQRAHGSDRDGAANAGLPQGRLSRRLSRRPCAFTGSFAAAASTDGALLPADAQCAARRPAIRRAACVSCASTRTSGASSSLFKTRGLQSDRFDGLVRRERPAARQSRTRTRPAKLPTRSSNRATAPRARASRGLPRFVTVTGGAYFFLAEPARVTLLFPKPGWKERNESSDPRCEFRHRTRVASAGCGGRPTAPSTRPRPPGATRPRSWLPTKIISTTWTAASR